MRIEPLVENRFDATLAKHPVAMVDFWAEWCGPCHVLTPVLEAVAAEHAGKAFAAKVDVDENPGLAQRMGIMGVPTVVFFRNGREVQRFVGVMPRARYDSALRALESSR